MESFVIEFGTLFYFVDPRRLWIEDVQSTPKFIVPAVPYFLLLIFVEMGKKLSCLIISFILYVSGLKTKI
jgi:hypothetical protein